jgi:hypothetical protein
MNTRLGIAAGIAAVTLAALAAPKPASAATFGKPIAAQAAAARDSDDWGQRGGYDQGRGQDRGGDRSFDRGRGDGRGNDDRNRGWGDDHQGYWRGRDDRGYQDRDDRRPTHHAHYFLGIRF